MKKNVMLRGGIAVLSICLLCLFLEARSVLPRFVQRPCTIISVQDDPSFNYIGEDKRTLVKWDDGSRSYVPGAMGDPGETITAARREGTDSIFGWFADYRR